jgi:hypothetical protein
MHVLHAEKNNVCFLENPKFVLRQFVKIAENFDQTLVLKKTYHFSDIICRKFLIKTLVLKKMKLFCTKLVENIDSNLVGDLSNGGDPPSLSTVWLVLDTAAVQADPLPPAQVSILLCTLLQVPPRGQFLTTWFAPGVKFAPRVEHGPWSELCPQGKCSPLRSPPGVNTLYCLEDWRGKQRIAFL